LGSSVVSVRVLLFLFLLLLLLTVLLLFLVLFLLVLVVDLFRTAARALAPPRRAAAAAL
jgi:hypothetical protein